MVAKDETTTDHEVDGSDELPTNRRGLVALLGAAAAFTGLGASRAKADMNATLGTASTSQYGAVATAGAGTAPIIPTLGTTTHGVIGSSSSLTTATVDSGVFGARSGAGRAGVLGANGGDGVGVMGVSPTAAGVYGESTSGPGVYGKGLASFGMVGEADTGVGIRGVSVSGIGVKAESTSSYGLFAQSYAPALPALYGLGRGTNPFAGLFRGRVRIVGDFSVSGAKAAAVPLPDGSLVTMYSQESPEPWFEDFGTARLEGGVARVSLDPRFASLVKLDGYMVFCTPEGDTGGLYVSAKSATDFEVRETGGGSGSFDFAYRIVARRKDIPGGRLAPIDLADHGPADEVEVAMMSPDDWTRHRPGSAEA